MWSRLSICLTLAGLTSSSRLCAEVVPAAQLQSPPKIARAAVLRAMVVLKIAPYLRGAAPKVKQPYRIAVVGKGDVATAMIKRLPNKAVRKRRVEVLALDAAKLLGETAPAFDLVFVAKSVKQEHVARILAKFQQMPTPLVCERPGFAAAGGLSLIHI